MAKIKFNKKIGCFKVPYNQFFPIRQVYMDGLLQNNRNYSLAYKMENMTISQFGKILKTKADNIQLLINNNTRLIVPSVQVDKKAKKDMISNSIKDMKVSMQGTQLNGKDFFGFIQSFLNKESNAPVMLTSDLIDEKIRANINHVVCCNTFYRVMFMRYLPEKLDTSLVHKVLDMPGSILSIHLTPAFLDVVEISDEGRFIEHKNSATVLKKFHTNIENNIPYYFAGFYFMLSAPTMEILDEQTNVLIKNCPSMIDTATHNQENGIVSVLPYGVDNLGIKSLISEKELYSFLPFQMGEGGTFEIQ